MLLAGHHQIKDILEALQKKPSSAGCLEEFGFNIILLKHGGRTSKTTVYDMVDIFIVMLLPSGGDELQGIKKV